MNERQFVRRGAIPNLIGGILANVGIWWKIPVIYASVSHKYNGAKYDYITIENRGGIEETSIARGGGGDSACDSESRGLNNRNLSTQNCDKNIKVRSKSFFLTKYQ